MKLQNLSVIFIIIVLPLLLIASYYISLQIDTINMQTAYNSKILDSTKEAIDAFEINTVEWNANYSETVDSKRRDVMASINTFLTSFANNTGVAGTSKDFMLSRIPAIAYTLYDGYYIYSPAETKIAVKDDNGVALYISEKLCNTEYTDGSSAIRGYSYLKTDDGKLLYQPKSAELADGTYVTQSGEEKPFTLDPNDADTEYKHILKPFTAYSEQLTDNIVINYTLDNYITLYGKMKDSDGSEKYLSKSGYLSASSEYTNNTINGTKFNGKEIGPEILKEKIAYTDDEINYSEGIFNYVYEAENTKVYYNSELNNFFRLDSNSKREYITPERTLYKKCTVPRHKGGKQTYSEYYQNLSNGKWYEKNNLDQYIELINYASYGLRDDKLLDYSAVNYCVESALFTEWVNGLGLPAFLNIDNSSNNPDPATNTNSNSAFENHKREVLERVLESNLNQSITSYSKNSEGAEFYLPELKESDWDQLLRNASIIAFVQNIPIGMKYYNNYAIATSTVNKEYVDPNEIYLYNEDNPEDEYYHMPYCNASEYTNNNLVGYRSIDFIQKNYESKDETGEDETKYYFRHSQDVSQACYNCIVQKSTYDETGKTEPKERKYFTALARERYIARMTKLPSEVEAEAYIDIKAYDDDGFASPVRYKLTSPEGEQIYTESSVRIPIKKNIESKSYVIETQAEDSTIIPTVSEFGETNIYGTTDTISTYGTYISDSKATINIIKYNNNNLQFAVVTEGNTQWGAGYAPEQYGEAHHETTLSVEDDAYINIKLNYHQNYTNNSGQIKSVWAKINEYNDLTIATKVTGVSGYVRLKFTNGSKEIYSDKIFNITNPSIDTDIYCKIDGTDWYSGDWNVEIVATDKTPITDMPTGIDHYAIGSKLGLTDFAEAVNGTKGPTAGAKTSGRTFKLISDITSVGDMKPIAENSSKKWFDGTFEGQNKIISGANIKSSTADGFGLFGWVGKPAIIKDLIIDGITVELSPDKGDCKTGGLAAFADEGEYIKKVTVKNSTIKGTTFVGGLVGESKKELNNCVFDNSRISSVGKTTTGRASIYIGGIAGRAYNKISNAEVKNNSQIGFGDVTMQDSSSSIIEDNCNYYYVGGITGYTSGNIENSSVTDNAEVKGGKILIEANDGTKSTDTNGATYTGGIVGYKNTTQDVNSAFQTNCKVSGHDNVGGMIGFNAGGNITGLTRSGSVTGTGENIGGIIGCNTGGNITECNNNATITGSGENVGGIIGCNYNKNINKCYNKGSVTGNKNVGGIAGVSYGGTIDYCGNEKTIIGNKNTNNLGFYYTGHKECTGTGGITGKLYNATILHSYNFGNIKCNYNGGGITGLNKGGIIEYSCNSANVSNSGTGSGSNRLGGICGAGDTVYINSCYNTGKITGTNDIDVLSNGMGGIIGSCVDNAYFLYKGKTEILPNNKYLGEVNVPVVKSGETTNKIMYCYNTGIIDGGTTSDTLNHNCGIVGCILWAPSGSSILLLDNYYLDNEDKGAKNSLSTVISSGVNKVSSKEMKQQLYKWADSSLKSESKHVYNTIAPLKINDKTLGYEGYGVLWWQLKNYVRLTSNMFLCNKNTLEDGTVKYTYTNFKNTGYNQTINLINSEDRETKINFRDTFSICKVDTNFNEPVNCSGCYKWIMMIPKGEYRVKGTTDFSTRFQIFNKNQKLFEGEEYYTVNIQEDKQIYIAPIIEMIPDTFDTEKITVVWDRVDTDVGVEKYANKYGLTKNLFDASRNKIDKRRGYYDLDPNESKATINGKTVNVYLDKFDEISKNQPIRFYRFEYYLRDYDALKVKYNYHGPYVAETGTDSGKKARADRAACTVYIEVENLVDLLGKDMAQNYIPHSAKVNMDYDINMWFDASDFGSAFTNAFKLKDSDIEWNIAIQKYTNTGWKNIKDIPYGVPGDITNSDNEKIDKFDDDGYYTVGYEVIGSDVTGSLSDVKYDDELRIAIHIVFKSKSAHANFKINSASLDITYGPNITE